MFVSPSAISHHINIHLSAVFFPPLNFKLCFVPVTSFEQRELYVRVDIKESSEAQSQDLSLKTRSCVTVLSE